METVKSPAAALAPIGTHPSERLSRFPGRLYVILYFYVKYKKYVCSPFSFPLSQERRCKQLLKGWKDPFSDLWQEKCK